MTSEDDAGLTPKNERGGRVGKKSLRLTCSLRKSRKPYVSQKWACLSVLAMLVMDQDQSREGGLGVNTTEDS